MSATNTQRMFLLISGIVLVLVIVLSIVQVRQAVQRRASMERKQDTLTQLEAMLEQQSAWQSALRPFEQLDTDRPPELARLLREQYPGLRADVQRVDQVTTWPGWQAERYRLSIDSLPGDTVGTVLYMLETQRPPWTLIEGQVRASSQQADQVRLTLIVEGVRRDR